MWDAVFLPNMNPYSKQKEWTTHCPGFACKAYFEDDYCTHDSRNQSMEILDWVFVAQSLYTSMELSFMTKTQELGGNK